MAGTALWGSVNWGRIWKGQDGTNVKRAEGREWSHNSSPSSRILGLNHPRLRKKDLSSWPPPVGLSPAPTKEHFEFWGAKGLGQLPKKKHIGPAADIQVRWLCDLGSESFYGVRSWSRLLDNQGLLLLSLSCTHCGLMIQGHPDKPAAHWGSQPSHPPRWQPLWLNIFNASKRRNCYCCMGREIVWGAGPASLQINRVMLCPALHLITLLLMKSSGKSSGWQFVAETLFSNRAKENLG